jgi:hypothetical protein
MLKVKSSELPSRQNLILTKKDKSGEAVTTWPICKYPAWPRYKGTGDINTASSFEFLME